MPWAARAAERVRRELGLHVRAGRQFSRRGLAYMAQAVAFQALLSFVPFLLLVVSFWGHWLGGDVEASRRLNEGLRLVIPFTAPALNRSLDALLRYPGFYAAISLATLLWLAGSVFRTIDYAINLAFDTHERLGAVLAHVKGIVLVLLFGVLLGVWVLSRSLLAVLSQALPPEVREMLPLGQGYFLGALLPLLVLTVLFTGLFHLLPHRKVAWRDAVRGGVLTALAFHGALRLFSWVLERTTSYNLLSGTVAALVGFLIWIYWASCVFLYGASMVAVLSERRDEAAR